MKNLVLALALVAGLASSAEAKLSKEALAAKVTMASGKSQQLQETAKAALYPTVALPAPFDLPWSNIIEVELASHTDATAGADPVAGKAHVSITDTALEQVSDEGIEFAIGHELSHLFAEHFIKVTYPAKNHAAPVEEVAADLTAAFLILKHRVAAGKPLAGAAASLKAALRASNSLANPNHDIFTVGWSGSHPPKAFRLLALNHFIDALKPDLSNADALITEMLKAPHFSFARFSAKAWSGTPPTKW